jgi:hypothetical protein
MIQQLPPLMVDQGQPFEAVINWERDGIPVDMTDWVGTITVKTAPKGDEVGSWFLSLDDSGNVTVTIDDTSDFPALPRLGRFVTAVFQIDLDEPGGAGQVFQGGVAVAGAV